jgi:hypothetical protein
MGTFAGKVFRNRSFLVDRAAVAKLGTRVRPFCARFIVHAILHTLVNASAEVVVCFDLGSCPVLVVTEGFALLFGAVGKGRSHKHGKKDAGKEKLEG